MVTYHIMDCALREVGRQIEKPIRGCRYGSVQPSQRAPAEIKDITIQHKHHHVFELGAQRIKLLLSVGPTGEQMQVRNDDAPSGAWLTVQTHASLVYADRQVNGSEIFARLRLRSAIPSAPRQPSQRTKWPQPRALRQYQPNTPPRY